MDKLYCWPASFPRRSIISLAAALIFAYGLVFYRGGLVGMLDILLGVLALLVLSGAWYLIHCSLESEYTDHFRRRILKFIGDRGWCTDEELSGLIPCGKHAKRKISESIIQKLSQEAVIKSGYREGRKIYELC